jgi:fructose-bisphosphate aldolase class II
MVKTLREAVADAQAQKVAIGHFNVSNLEGVWAVFQAALNLRVPVIIGVSEGERDFVGVSAIAAVVASIRKDFNYPIYLNADHSYSFERVKTAIDAGFDAAIIDGTKLSFEDNVAMTTQCVEYAKTCGRDVLIEGELGYIGQSSKILDAVPDGVVMTTPEDAKKFVDATGIDMLAPAVGNIHGMLKGGVDPKLNIELIGQISQVTGKPLVLHGGSGNSDDDFRAAIAHGVAIVHINTELRVAYKTGLQKAFTDSPDEIAPYKYEAVARDAMQAVASHKLKVFNNIM